MNLAEFQDNFVSLLTSDQPASLEDLAELNYLTKTILNAKRVNVCRARVADSLAQTIRNVYNTVQQIVGESFITAAAQAYFRQYPSRTANPLARIESFPTFLEEYPPAEAFPYLADVAMLDLGYQWADHAPESSRVTPATLTQMSPAKLTTHRVRLHPACFWFSSEYAIYDIWRLYHNHRSASAIDHRVPQDVVIIRSEDTVDAYQIDAGFTRALDALDEGATLDEAFARGREADPNFDAGAALQFLVKNGLIAAFY